jgi:hypothetical protein
MTLANLLLGNLRFDILVFSASGVLIGAWLSPDVPDRLRKTIFARCMLWAAPSRPGERAR